ncbi:MAG: helix-turn-helix domain-containing protein [Candidatus Dojkabacteria bacterium]|jgi:cytoskeletal protein RodZ
MITVGEVLKNKRERLKISLDTASSETKIQKRFLQYIEKDEFFPFESEVFLTGFIKIYAKYLNLDVEKVLALYRRTNPIPKEKKENTPKNTYTTRKKREFVITPKVVITVLLIVFSFLIIGYIGYQIYKFQKPPQLTISSPKNESTITEENIKVIGKTEKDVAIEINDVVVETNENGEFQKEITLVEGSNLITIKAKKNNNSVLEMVETIKVTYTKPTEEPKEEIIVNKIKLEIFDSAAWIKLDIDNENKLSQVVQPSTNEYEIKDKLHIVSGRVSNTRVYFNEELLAWPPTTEKGVAGMECTVENNSIKCE